MNVLAIETSSANLSFSAMCQDRIVVNYNRRLRFGASKIILYLEKSLKQASLDFGDFDAFIIGSGPGSFTGLRISFALVKAFALALQKPVIAIPSFYAVAYPFAAQHRRITVIADARRDLVYTGSFTVERGVLRSEGHTQLMKLEECIGRRKDYFFLTYDHSIRQKALAQYPRMHFHRTDCYPCAKHLCFIGKDYYNKKRFTPVSRLEPLYLHPKTCQIVNRVP
ncbi:MAG: tRNA (adenosine(37)-N6)-threonylcarbamoyltransferase complex dimerization subunit type 1 TsaB [Candidatus Omnitrophota bacterium]